MSSWATAFAAILGVGPGQSRLSHEGLFEEEEDIVLDAVLGEDESRVIDDEFAAFMARCAASEADDWEVDGRGALADFVRAALGKALEVLAATPLL